MQANKAKVVGFCPWIRAEDFECYKVGYDTPQEAFDCIDRKRKRKGQHECRSYRCHKCGKFHLTSEEER